MQARSLATPQGQNRYWLSTCCHCDQTSCLGAYCANCEALTVIQCTQHDVHWWHTQLWTQNRQCLTPVSITGPRNIIAVQSSQHPVVAINCTTRGTSCTRSLPDAISRLTSNSDWILSQVIRTQEKWQYCPYRSAAHRRCEADTISAAL